jgi:tetratricopeptide (TPR) repeat protein
MRVKYLGLALGVSSLCLSSVSAWSAPPEAPRNVKVEAATPRSAELSSRAASAEMAGDPQDALKLSEKTIAANPRDPWGYYGRAIALRQLGRVDDALQAYSSAEGLFAPSDLWGRSVAIYGRAHALEQAGRCTEAKGEFERYAAFVRERDPKSADMATRYAADCRSPASEAPHPSRP